MYTNTADLREGMCKLLKEVEEGKHSNTTVRARCAVAKVITDTLKVEIAAAAIGKNIDALAFAPAARVRPRLKQVA